MITESQYRSYEPEQLEELLSNFLVSSWSYSKVTGFARNEKAFEMQHIYGVYSKSSSTTMAGNAYHAALDYYFAQKMEGKQIDLIEMEQAAFDYLASTGANKWKLQKTTPTVEAAHLDAVKKVTSLLKNFWTEKALYEEDLAEVLFVEMYGSEFVTVNGVDIPLPLNFKMDLGIRLNDDRIVLIDHKSKNAFTPEDEMALSIGIQAITYVKGFETKTGLTVDEVWFIENKYSQNKDKSAQLAKMPVEITDSTRRLYEALLYEPLRRMLEAVSDADYVYLINDSDKFVDMAELYDFWARTMISEVSVEDFNVEESKKELVGKRLRKIRDSAGEMISPTIIRKFKQNADKFIQYDMSNKDMTPEQKIEHALKTFSVLAKVAHVFEGYSCNTYLVEVGAGVRVASIYGYRMDIANALDVANVRISSQMKVYKGKSYLSIEAPKERNGILLFEPNDRVGKKIPIGRDNYGDVVYWDLENHSTPHMLVCGATGSGKSVCMTNIVEYAKEEIDNIIILDPKYSRDFMKYRRQGILVINDIEEIVDAMDKLVVHMEQLVKQGKEEYTLVIFDEFADALSNAGKTLEINLRKLAQKGRSCGIRLVAGTQRASVKVITGDAKANFPVQICFRMPKEIDSKVVLDEAGAESLTGKGDGLIKSPEYNDTVRFQAYFKPETTPHAIAG
ncbi:DNA translocase FtsK [Paraflavitalea pollutisoli]|uniref:DNA translocase FtsK n=1 Tax=Paraflavitalea pollutisoli TaxID=3034143 RepID=UPI0023EAFCDF|nr:DNA translocase FtsK [Paraflavitalea sp. H1-2-19X]